MYANQGRAIYIYWLYCLIVLLTTYFFGDFLGTICKIALKSGVNLYKKRGFLGVAAPLTPSFGCSNHFAPAKSTISCGFIRVKYTRHGAFFMRFGGLRGD